ncbi:hypothetical protein ECDEC5C_3441 [Escherichia coli DEC5C]|nr:hypothetical protein ECDEC5C_3441 [Escherichia coli DEC5C]EHV37548.1 hypothetical protein ECDEC5D_3570 [Escherichia coli DEC5D]
MVVYPHWRGELLDFNFFAARFCGLSPLARGTLDSSHDIQSEQRFIPAGAGNSYY